jgi:hypothetical protein
MPTPNVGSGQKEECLSRAIHAEQNHQGKGNVLLFPRAAARQREGPVRCHKRLGGLLRYYHREAALMAPWPISFLTLRHPQRCLLGLAAKRARRAAIFW